MTCVESFTRDGFDIEIHHVNGRNYEVMIKQDETDGLWGFWTQDVTGDNCTDYINMSVDDGSEWFRSREQGIVEIVEFLHSVDAGNCIGD